MGENFLRSLPALAVCREGPHFTDSTTANFTMPCGKWAERLLWRERVRLILCFVVEVILEFEQMTRIPKTTHIVLDVLIGAAPEM